MSQRRRHPARPQGQDRQFTVEPVPLPTVDLHKLTQALLNAAIDRARQEHQAPTRPGTLASHRKAS